MAFDPEFLDLMPHTILVKPLAGTDEYGDPTYGTGSPFPALVEERITLTLNQFGEEVVSSHTVYVASTSRIPVTSQVTVGGDDLPELISSSLFSDEDGGHHCVLRFGGA